MVFYSLRIGNHFIAADHGTRSGADVVKVVLRWLEAGAGSRLEIPEWFGRAYLHPYSVAAVIPDIASGAAFVTSDRAASALSEFWSLRTSAAPRLETTLRRHVARDPVSSRCSC